MDLREAAAVEKAFVAPALPADAWLHVMLPVSQALGGVLALLFLWGRVRSAWRLTRALRGKHGGA